MVALRRHAALLSCILVAHRGTFVNAQDASHVDTLKIELKDVSGLSGGLGAPKVYVCLYLTKDSATVPSDLTPDASTTGPVHLPNSIVIGCTTTKASRNTEWSDAVFYIPVKNIGDYDTVSWWLQAHVWSEVPGINVDPTNSAPSFQGGSKQQINSAHLTSQPYSLALNKGNAACTVTASLEKTPSRDIFDRSCMSFSDMDDTLASGAHEALKGDAIPGSDNRFSYERNYPGFPLMLRTLCASLTFLSARPLTPFGSLENLATNSINKWPQLAEVHKTNPFYHVAYLGGTIKGSVFGTVGCQLPADSNNQTKRDGCELFATDKVNNYRRFMTRFPQYKKIFLFGDNEQGDFSAWTQIVGTPVDGIQVRAYIRETLVDKCQQGKCVYRWLNATTGYALSMVAEDMPGGVTVVRGWHCLLNMLTKTSEPTEGYFTATEKADITTAMNKEVKEIGGNLALYGGAGVDNAAEKKLYFDHWVDNEHKRCGFNSNDGSDFSGSLGNSLLATLWLISFLFVAY